MQNNKNKGFSLIELIIVIAIMAVLIGILVPTYLKYVEKSRVSSDSELANSISKAVTYASVDEKVLSDPASATQIAAFTSATKLEDIDPTCEFAQEVLSVLGWDDFSRNNYLHLLKSNHNSSTTIYIQNEGTLNTPFAVWITFTDRTASGNIPSSEADDVSEITNCICARSR